MVQGLGLRVWGLGLGFWVQGSIALTASRLFSRFGTVMCFLPGWSGL